MPGWCFFMYPQRHRDQDKQAVSGGWGKLRSPFLTARFFCTGERQSLTTGCLLWRRQKGFLIILLTPLARCATATCVHRRGDVRAHGDLFYDTSRLDGVTIIIWSLFAMMALPPPSCIWAGSGDSPKTHQISPYNSHSGSSESLFSFIPRCVSQLLLVLAFPYAENAVPGRRQINDAGKLWPQLMARRSDRLSRVGRAAASMARRAPSHFIPRRVEPRGLSGSAGFFSFHWLISLVSFCFTARSHSHLYTMGCVLSLSFSRRRGTHLTSKSSFDWFCFPFFSGHAVVQLWNMKRDAPYHCL